MPKVTTPPPAKTTPSNDNNALTIPTGTDDRTELILRLGNLRCADSNRIIQLVLAQLATPTTGSE